jgi:hypothetical protein
MPYYTRVLTRRSRWPTVSELTGALHDEHPQAKLVVEQGDEATWTELLLTHGDGTEIAAIERNAVAADTLGEAEIGELLDELDGCRPASAADFLRQYLPTVRTVYAFQHLAGSNLRAGDAILRSVSNAIWALGDAILQADGEGFSNEDGYHILWQFSESAKGPWWMAVLQHDDWVAFEMDLGNPAHRKAFLDGRVPAGAKLA